MAYSSLLRQVRPLLAAELYQSGPVVHVLYADIETGRSLAVEIHDYPLEVAEEVSCLLRIDSLADWLKVFIIRRFVVKRHLD